jgi:hypothetical protein
VNEIVDDIAKDVANSLLYYFSVAHIFAFMLKILCSQEARIFFLALPKL